MTANNSNDTPLPEIKGELDNGNIKVNNCLSPISTTTVDDTSVYEIVNLYDQVNE